MSIESEIRERAGALGFAAVGITDASPIDARAHLDAAIEAGRNASMRWLARDPARRCDPTSLLPDARSVICCAYPYTERGLPPHAAAPDTRRARFARSAEYHEVMREKLDALWATIAEGHPNARAKICVDTSPLLEKALAQRAGLGWIGKHTLLVNEALGSFFVLGEIITDLDLAPNTPAENRCGDCRACLDACPTAALIAPYHLDARRCISYLTIEAPRHNPEDVPSHESRVTSHGFTYGCDICQEACPYNALHRDPPFEENVDM